MQTLEFINVTGADIAGDHVLKGSTTNRHRVRSQAMRDFRRREREERMTGTQGVVDDTSDESQSDHRKNEIARSKAKVKASRTLRPPVAVSTSKVWRHLFAQKLTEAWFPPGYRGAALDNIAYTYDVLSSAPIATIQDTLSMLNAGSTAKIDRLLLEARKRYLATIVLLRQHASGKASDMPIIMLGYLAMACLMCETYSTIASESGLVTWQKHVLGISTLVASSQHDSFSQAMGGFLFQQIRVAQLVYSLHERVPFPQDLAIHPLPTQQDRLHSLLVLAFQVPELLKATDLRLAGRPRDSYDSLVERLSIQMTALSTWLGEFTVSEREQERPLEGVTMGVTKVQAGPAPISLTGRSSIFNLTCETLCRICLLLIVESLVSLEHQMWPKRSPSSAADACASDLLNTMTMLENAAVTPICKARVMSAPLHFLSGYYARNKDRAGLRLCEQIKEALQSEAPYLHWDALLPWCLLTLSEIPHYDADSRT